MSEEVPDTVDGAIRGWIVAVGFTLVLVGGELMVANKDSVSFYTGMGLAVAGLPCYLAAALWRTIKPQLSGRFVVTLNAVATDARWWTGGLFIILFVLSVSSIATEKMTFVSAIIIGIGVLGKHRTMSA